MPIIIDNWKIYKNEDNEFVLSAWISNTNHSKFQENESIRDFATGNSQAKTSRHLPSHHEYMFKPSSIIRVKNFDPMWMFSLGKETICFTFNGRFKNPRYTVQTLDEIEMIIEH